MNSLFDRSEYPQSALDTFEVIAAYYVDIYYNHLFLEAKNMKSCGTVSKVVEGYKHALSAFLQSFDNARLYKKSLVGLHKFFTDNGVFSSVSFTQFTSNVVREFVPQDHFACTSHQQQMTILRAVLTQANKKFIESIVTNHLRMIVDDHNNGDNIRILQDLFIDFLMIERESIYQRFIVSRTKTNQKVPHISNAVFEKMQDEIKRLHKEKFEIGRTTLQLKQIILNKENKIKELLARIDDLNDTINELQANFEAKVSNPATPDPSTSVLDASRLSGIISGAEDGVNEDVDDDLDVATDAPMYSAMGGTASHKVTTVPSTAPITEPIADPSLLIMDDDMSFWN